MPPTPTVCVGSRLERPPLSGVYRRILALIAAGMLFGAFDIYLQSSLLGALVHDGWWTPAIAAAFVPNTFLVPRLAPAVENL